MADQDSTGAVADESERGARGGPGGFRTTAVRVVTMTGPATPIPQGPPFSADVVADVHAGVYPEAVTVALRQRIAADPEAAALLSALDDTVADLAAWHDPTPIPMPDAYAARLDAAIAAEAAARAGRVISQPGASATSSTAAPPSAAATSTSPGGPLASRPVSAPPPAGRASGSSGPGRVSSLDDARSRRTRRWAVGLGVAAAFAAVLTIGVVLLRPAGTAGNGLAGGEPSVTSTATTGPSGAPSTPAPGASQPGGAAIVADPNHLEQLLTQIVGISDAGPYADPAVLSACLAANGVKNTNVLGVREVSYQGSTAYAISLGLDEATAKILIVGNSCGVSGSDLMTSQTAGR